MLTPAPQARKRDRRRAQPHRRPLGTSATIDL